MDALKKNLRQEHVLIHEFLSTFYTQVTTCIPRISQKNIHRSSPGGGSMSAHKSTSCVWQAGNTARAIPTLSGFDNPGKCDESSPVNSIMCCPQTLTPLLGARLLVKSFPWYPDIPAVCIWISALAGNADALTELRRLLPDETIEPPH